MYFVLELKKKKKKKKNSNWLFMKLTIYLFLCYNSYFVGVFIYLFFYCCFVWYEP